MKKASPVSRSGRFAGGPAADVAQFTESVSFDRRLWRHDLAGSKAHATLLRKVGLLSSSEWRCHIPGLDALGKEIEAGKIPLKPEPENGPMENQTPATQ